MIGYTDIVTTNVRVVSDKTTTLEFELMETSLELGETIEIIAEKPLIKKDLTSTESSIGRDVIEILPVDDFNDVNPSAENIAVRIWQIITAKLDPELKVAVELYETERNFVLYDGPQ